MRRIISGLGAGVLMILEGGLRLFLELAKAILLLFGLIARVFLAFVRVGTV